MRGATWMVWLLAPAGAVMRINGLALMASMVCLALRAVPVAASIKSGNSSLPDLDVRHDGLQGLDLLVDGLGKNSQVTGRGLEIYHEDFGLYQELVHVVNRLVHPVIQILLHDQHPQSPLALREVQKYLVDMFNAAWRIFSSFFRSSLNWARCPNMALTF